MKDFTVRQSASDGSFEVIEWTYPTPTSFRGEILYATGCFETANAVCDQFILDADPAYREWLELQDAEFA